MKQLILNELEIRDFWICNNKRRNVPHCFALPRNVYSEHYHRKFRHIIPDQNIGIIEKHEDTYVHCTFAENAEKILKEGILRCGNNDYCTLGSAVYTFPLGSGRVFDHKDLVAIVFKADAEHVHLVDDTDSSTVLGEADFLQDVKIYDTKLYLQETLNDLSLMSWDARTGLYKYYGFKEDEIKPEYFGITLEQLPDFIEEKVVSANYMFEECTKSANSF